ncbi:MAG: glutamine-hydrolyzing GMP synthase [Planctomycetota bacterium]
MGTTSVRGHEMIAVIDFGSQYTQLIARRIRELKVYCEIYPCHVDVARIRALPGLKGIVLSGGPNSVYVPGAPRLDPSLLDLGVPVLGICYGMQVMALAEEGIVHRGTSGEYGRASMRLVASAETVPLLRGLAPQATVWMSHGDQVGALPAGFEVLASSSACPVAAMRHRERPLYGLQFHPEVTHTEQGRALLLNFLVQVCHCAQSWEMASYVERTVAGIRARVGAERVILGLSGGVDSSVAALLCQQAIGDRLTAIFVDNGLLRKGEAEQVERTFRDHFQIDLRVARSSQRFLAALAGVTDPEEKRRRIGRLFIDVFAEQARALGDVRFLAQGTLYPDVIESQSVHGGPTSTIKTHHNVGGLPEDLRFELIEPLRELFKDEVRHVGRLLGLPETILKRHPFPGPGLAVRVIGPVTPEALEILRAADAIFLDELERASLYEATAQAFCVLLPVRSVGVMGDARTYEQVIALRAVKTFDFMTADWADLPYAFLGLVANRIANEVKGVNRVVYDISSKPPATIEWE